MTRARVPWVTLGFVGAQLAANVAAGTHRGPLPPDLLRRWGVSAGAVIGHLELWRLASATLLTLGPGMLLRQVLFAGLALGVHEHRLGARRTLATFAVADAGSILSVLSVLAARGPAGDGLTALHDVGMSGGGFGLLGSLAGAGPHRRTLVVAGALALLGEAALRFDPLTDGIHLVAFLAGAAMGWRAEPPRRA